MLPHADRETYAVDSSVGRMCEREQAGKELGAGRREMFPNHGGCPGAAAGHRVHVRLRRGYETHGSEPQGWPADGKGGCRWFILNDPFDILEWELVQ